MSESMKHFSHEYDGPDASLEISLREYGFAWHDTGTEFHFLYGIKVNNAGEYIRFDRGWLSKDVDIRKEYSWIFCYEEKFSPFLACFGITLEEWLKLPLQMQVYDIFQYYGYENTFGSSDWTGDKYSEIFAVDENNIAKIHGS